MNEPRGERSRGRGPAIGVILAGGAGRRIGGAKARVELGGRPLIAYPLCAMREAFAEVVVLAKDRAELPDLPGVPLWIERERRRHPLTGILAALAAAGGRPVVVCAVDLPFVTPELLCALAAADPGSSPAVVARYRGMIEPVLARYEPQAEELLRRAEGDERVPLRATVASLPPRYLEVEDPDLLLNVNRSSDLAWAHALLARRRLTLRWPTSSAPAG